MRRSFASAAALVAVVALSPTVAPAASLSVDVVDSRFEPSALQAVAGDTITWTFRGSAQHNVTAYSGASFASPTQRTGTFPITFGGGTALYRCTLHSTVDQGRCNGMCGVISNDVTPPPAPEITQPAASALTTSSVRIGGTALGGDSVLLLEGTRALGEAVIADGAWSLTVMLSDGAHTVHAVARSPIGIRSEPSASVTFTVDAVAPTIAITTPGDLAVTGDPVAVEGTASDDRQLASVTLELTDLLLGGTSTSVAILQPDGTWAGTVDAPHAGPHRLIARARDAAGNVTTRGPVTVLVGLSG